LPAFHPFLVFVVVFALILHGKINLPEGGVAFKGRPNEPGGKIGTSHDNIVTLKGKEAQNERWLPSLADCGGILL
jgi:hypothetical protein